MRVDVRHRSSRCLILVLVLTLASLPRAEAFPINPQTLWELTAEAELVVWADVDEVVAAPRDRSAEKKPRFTLDGEIARLHVREVWKGSARQDERLEVRFDSRLVCPAPPRYEPGLAVVAFLRRHEGKWFTVALSYGTRYPTSRDEADAYRRVVTRAAQAQERTAGKAANLKAAQTDWQVLAASHPATRWDGLYALVPEADEHHAWFDSRAPRGASLSPEQREQLARGFVEHPPLDRALPMMLMALRGHASKEVDGVAARALETVLDGEEVPHWAGLAFNLLRERLGEKVKARTRVDGDPLLRGMQETGTGASPLIQEWKRLKERHSLEPKLLPLPVEPPVPGTGGETPL
ncbi:hypothetical protein [Pyxidicoccus xibeiensis]|uniref:hypothetical protein n=1 Tax=Pyxidicoccus xibeiensis TaxID=2906759 RepID=UPI0020A6F340|nr:hypothetical protein [Pyxidicoccus xibeiensis]MCP3140835.1 hypothetical protein [Pyxidicoccus xibeiensis]